MTQRWSALIEVWLGEVTHPDLVSLHGKIDGIDAGGTLRVAQFRTDFTSRGQIYRAAAFRFRPPAQGGPDNTISLSIDNVDNEITAALSQITAPATVTLEKVFAHAPDTPTVAYRGLQLLSANWDRSTVSAGIGRKRTSGPLIGITVNPADFPAGFSADPNGAVGV